MADSDHVMGIKPIVVKVAREVDEQGKPKNTPEGEPVYYVNWHPVFRHLTKAEWDVLKLMEKEGDAGD